MLYSVTSLRDVDIALVGRGAFLSRAYAIASRARLRAAVYLTGAETDRLVFESQEVPILGFGDPNRIVSERLQALSGDTPVVCANNQFILSERFLRRFPKTYNIHISDVRVNRGFGQLCLVDSMIRRENATGVTVQRLRPGDGVDASPTLSIVEVPFEDGDSFSLIMASLVRAWSAAFGELLQNFRDPSKYYQVNFGGLVTHESLRTRVLVEDGYSLGLHRRGLEHYSAYFPKSNRLVEEFRRHWG
jgi:folate-dependent phosphoribosylglycinamide formyltransferase PurN